MHLGERYKWFCYYAEALLLASWLVEGSFDHLHCHFGNSGSSTGMLAARLAGIPFSLTCHGSELKLIEKHHLREKVAEAAFVACVSHYGRAQLMSVSRRGYWNKLHVVRCGITRPEGVLHAHANSPAHILCVARLASEKGHLILLEALQHLHSNGHEFKCTLVGDGPIQPLIAKQIQQLGLNEIVVLTGSLPPQRVAQLYQSADVFVLASFSEGVPVVLMEAMAYAMPIVATHVGGVPELVDSGHSGRLVPPGDADALARALEQVLVDPSQARTFGRNGLKRVMAGFNIDESAKMLKSLMEAGVEARIPEETRAIRTLRHTSDTKHHAQTQTTDHLART